MARVLKKEKTHKQAFFDDLISAIGDSSFVGEDVPENKDELKHWIKKPPTLKEFCDNWVGESLFPIQQEFGDAVLGVNPMEFGLEYEEGHAFWGKGSGKDRTIAKLQAYVICKLLHLKNPQGYLREFYGASIGEGDSLDLINMSINARQGENVYFKKFKNIIRITTNPSTGRNFFKEQGVDIRDGYDLLGNMANFPHNITAHSLNSETNTGEGLSPFFATIDEFGGFKPSAKAFSLLEAVEDSCVSRFPNGLGKVLVISYMYHYNDPMFIIYNKGLNDPKVFSSRHASYEVNPLITKQSLARKFSKNPEGAEMTYACTGGSEGSGFVTKKFMLDKAFSGFYDNPIVGDLISVKSEKLLNMKFKENFRGETGRYYVVHMDLATGKDKNDCVGLAMSHCEMFETSYDKNMIKELLKDGINVEVYSDDYKAVQRKGVVTDLAIQIVGETGEVEFATLRSFVVERLKKQLGFNIVYITLDGWQSKDTIQQFNRLGIQSWVESVDKDADAYVTWKELMYQSLWFSYPNLIAKREAKELMVDDQGKIDHPEKSFDREQTEGRDDGSKDVIDCIVANTKVAYEKIPLGITSAFG